jgi:hypothetical protein
VITTLLRAAPGACTVFDHDFAVLIGAAAGGIVVAAQLIERLARG